MWSREQHGMAQDHVTAFSAFLHHMRQDIYFGKSSHVTALSVFLFHSILSVSRFTSYANTHALASTQHKTVR